MLKVFIEYKVDAEQSGKYFSLLPAVRKQMESWQVQQYRIYEGTDQPLLMVEEFLVADQSRYERYKNDRLSGADAFWNEVHACVAGGAGKVHMWAFQEIM